MLTIVNPITLNSYCDDLSIERSYIETAADTDQETILE